MNSVTKRTSMLQRFKLPLLAMLMCGLLSLACSPALAASSTTTILTATPTSISAGAIVTLTASVASGNTPLNAGQVEFCNAAAAHCEDGALLGSAWVTTSGTATLRRALPVGTTSIKAVYRATNSFSSSASTVQSVSVTGVQSTNLVQEFPAGAMTVQSFIAGDFNNDGHVDLLSTDADGGPGALFLGTGPGTFTAGPVPTFFGSNASWATGDFNRDGNLDLVGSNPPRVFLGQGDGTFDAGQTLPITDAGSIEEPIVVVGDFNGDGIADVAVLSGSASDPLAKSVQVFFGKGDGTFVAGPVSTFGTNGEAAIGAAAGYLSNNGQLDLIVGTTLPGGGGNTYILAGGGDGTFSVAQTIPGPSSASYAIGDFNGDGNLDFAMNGGSYVRIELGTGAGTFTEGTPVTGFISGPIVAADFNGDGFTDLAWSADGTPSSVVVMPGNGDGTFGAALNYNASSTTNETALAVGDFFNSGLPSIAIGSGSPSDIALFPWDGVTNSASGSVANPATASGTAPLLQADASAGLIKMSPMAITLPAAGIISTVAGAGSGCAGQTDALGDGCAATSGKLNYPAAVALDAAGNIYIADDSDFRIRKVTASTGIISTVAGDGTDGASGNGGTATSASLDPSGVAVDGAGNIYIADEWDGLIRKVTASTGIISIAAGNGGHAYNGDNIAATSAELDDPFSVAVDAAGNFYIADYEAGRIRKVTISTGLISTVAGGGGMVYSGDGAAAVGAGIGPLDVTVDSAGNVYIADTYNDRVRAVNTQATMQTILGVSIAPGDIQTVAGNGTVAYSGDGGHATSAELSGARSVEVDTAGNLYIGTIDDCRIRKVTASTGIISTVAGNGTCSYNGDGIVATTAEMNAPYGVKVDGDSNIYIADYVNARIRVVGGVGVVVSASPASAVYGAVNSTLTATLSSSSATGTVTFSNGQGWTSSPISLSSGIASTSISNATWPAGSYTITAVYSGGGSYGPSSGTTSFAVTPAVLTVTANNASSVYGAALPAFTAVYSGFVNGDTSAVLSGAPSLTTTATPASPAGTYPITAASGTLSAANYTSSRSSTEL